MHLALRACLIVTILFGFNVEGKAQGLFDLIDESVQDSARETNNHVNGTFQSIGEALRDRDRSDDVCYQMPTGSDAQIACLGDHVMAIRDDRARNIMLGNCYALGTDDFSRDLSYICTNGVRACSILDNGDAAYHCGECGATRRWLATYSLGYPIQCF